MHSHRSDVELEELIAKRISTVQKKLIVVGTGITSSHLGDERNLREFLVANSLVNKLRNEGINVIFYLFDDSYDPLNFRQLRVAVNKDEKLIKKFEKYCGMPIKLIPDPYECHPSYSTHYQNEILERFHSLDIFPNIIDTYNSYESRLYDHAKEIVFHNYKRIKASLKKNFPHYSMKKVFWPLCPKCFYMEGVDIKRIAKGRVTVACSHCGNRFTDAAKNIHGKFGWKIDAAVKWNVFNVDFEPYSKAYLDPDVGSYFIAKKISEEFLGGYYPEIVSYGQIIMDKTLSYKILSSFPKDILQSFFIKNRKKDMVLSEKNILQFAHEYKIDDKLSFYEYIVTRLPYDLFEHLQGKEIHPHYKKFMDHGMEFAKHFLNRDLYPKIPKKEAFEEIDRPTLIKMRKLFQWVILRKMEDVSLMLDTFPGEVTNFLIKNKINKVKLFHEVRKLLSQEQSLPMGKILYFVPITYLYECLLVLTKVLFDIKETKTDKKNGTIHKSRSIHLVI